MFSPLSIKYQTILIKTSLIFFLYYIKVSDFYICMSKSNPDDEEFFDVEDLDTVTDKAAKASTVSEVEDAMFLHAIPILALLQLAFPAKRDDVVRKPGEKELAPEPEESFNDFFDNVVRENPTFTTSIGSEAVALKSAIKDGSALIFENKSQDTKTLKKGVAQVFSNFYKRLERVVRIIGKAMNLGSEKIRSITSTVSRRCESFLGNVQHASGSFVSRIRSKRSGQRTRQ